MVTSRGTPSAVVAATPSGPIPIALTVYPNPNPEPEPEPEPLTPLLLINPIGGHPTGAAPPPPPPPQHLSDAQALEHAYQIICTCYMHMHMRNCASRTSTLLEYIAPMALSLHYPYTTLSARRGGWARASSRRTAARASSGEVVRRAAPRSDHAIHDAPTTCSEQENTSHGDVKRACML